MRNQNQSQSQSQYQNQNHYQIQSQNDDSDDEYSYECSAKTLHEKSAFLRQIAVDMLTPQEMNEHEHEATNTQSNNNNNNKINKNSNNNNKRNNEKILKRRRKTPLFLQGNEYLYRDDLLHVAASQYDLTGREYCDLMRKDGVWGGGPEIVAISNYLARPIHVYELVTVRPPPPPPPPSTSQKTKANDGNGGLLRWGVGMGIGIPSFLSTSVEQRNFNSNANANVNGAKISRLCEGSKPEFRLRRMACFGSPKFDHKEPLHILSADCRFPDLKPGHEATNGNHFLAIFPVKRGHLNLSKRDLRDGQLSTRRMGFKVRSGAASDASSAVSSGDKSSKSKSLTFRGEIKKPGRDGSNSSNGTNRSKDVKRRRFMRLQEKKKISKTRSQTRALKHQDINILEKNIFHSWIGRCLMDQWMKLESCFQ